MSDDLELFRQYVATSDDGAVLNMAPTIIDEIERLRAEVERMQSIRQRELCGNAENVDWDDLAASGRAYADNLIGETSISALMHLMADAIDRLRFTAAERDALVTLCGDSSKWANPHVQLLLQYLERNKLLGSTEPRA